MSASEWTVVIWLIVLTVYLVDTRLSQRRLARSIVELVQILGKKYK